MRTYIVHTIDKTHPRYFLNGYGEIANSPYRIRETVFLLFRRYFGRPAASCWHVDGFMAEAYSEPDCRGISVQIIQENRCMEPIALLPPHKGWPREKS